MTDITIHFTESPNMTKVGTPTPFIDTLEAVITQYKSIIQADSSEMVIKQWLKHCTQETKKKLPEFAAKNYEIALRFLYSYRGSKQTFDAYRRELERLIQWSWFVHQKSILLLKREDIEDYIEFCIKPPKSWIGLKKVARFKKGNGQRIPNSQWRPFEVTVNKKDFKLGKIPDKSNYAFSQRALKALFAILSSFFNYCLQEEKMSANPIALIRQKSKFIRKEAKTPVIRRLTEYQWQTVIGLAKQKAQQTETHERAVFILSCLYGMYLRISELTASDRWLPTMGDFFKDIDGNWWFRTVGKGNKARQIAVSDAMLKALIHYRTHYLKLTPYPEPAEKTPLIGHLKNHHRPMTDERAIRRIVQACFDEAAEKLNQKDPEEAQNLYFATVHWLRHTGISDDVKLRPREHVRDDAGHSSGAITDKYIDVELAARARSAKDKTLSSDT